MDQNVVLAVLIALCGCAAADKQAIEALDKHGGIHHLPISSEWAVPAAHDVHRVISVYVPSYEQDATYTFPQHYGHDVHSTELKKSPLVALLTLLAVPKTFLIGLASGILWVYSNLAMLILGVGMTVALCFYTHVCHISFTPLHHEFRSLATPARIDAAAYFLKDAIKKYTTLQYSTEANKDAA